MNSVRKAIEVAMACVSQTTAKRPTMKQVVFDLNESLAIEMDRTTVGHEIESKESIESISLNLSSELPPLARTGVSPQWLQATYSSHFTEM
ncbi:hypothetical protein EZV62_003671 [Acer yangbiense]|uniref:Serine-threonine/tyrosine-protein kinase catalytic domain-containing protein n=1 Tax=Acer yangbiense TaxID=1000413 RepID=A0A5C7IJW3_9ROSI|nr:hypothetical protein EZV62_003671 [Acer yangbiense]